MQGSSPLLEAAGHEAAWRAFQPPGAKPAGGGATGQGPAAPPAPPAGASWGVPEEGSSWPDLQALRLQALQDCRVLDTEAEARFD